MSYIGAAVREKPEMQEIRLDSASSGASQVALLVKNPLVNAGDLGSIPGLARFPREGDGNPL